MDHSSPSMKIFCWWERSTPSEVEWFLECFGFILGFNRWDVTCFRTKQVNKKFKVIGLYTADPQLLWVLLCFLIVAGQRIFLCVNEWWRSGVLQVMLPYTQSPFCFAQLNALQAETKPNSTLFESIVFWTSWGYTLFLFIMSTLDLAMPK